jgi:hypothetical protein
MSVATQGGGGDLQSNIFGPLGTLSVATDIKDAIIRVGGGVFATLGKVVIGGSLIGGIGAESGTIESLGDMGPITVRGDVIGGSGPGAGGIDVGGKLASLTILGSIIGGSADFFGTLGGGIFREGQVAVAGSIGPVKVGKDVIGQGGFASGEIRSGGSIASITIGGSLIGGTGSVGGHLCSEVNMGPVKIGRDIIGGRNFITGAIEVFGRASDVTIGGSIVGGTASVSGVITSGEGLGKLKIGGDLIGGSIANNEPTLNVTGAVRVYNGPIASVTIRGSIIAGVDSSASGVLTESGSVIAGDDIGSLAVKGSLIGNITANGVSRVVISARGQATPTTTSDVAIGKINIGGRVEHALILAGYLNFAPSNGNAQIGSVMVGGEWRASSLVAGVVDTDADGYGDADDAVIATPAVDEVIARIASVTIKGFVFGTGVTGDHFGFVAQQIGFFQAGGNKLPLTQDTDAPFNLALITDDVKVREVQ